MPTGTAWCLARSLVALTLTLLPATAAAQRLLLREVCDASALLTVVGVDSRSRTALLALGSRQAEVPGWLLEVRPGATRVLLHPDGQREARFGGSMGPGGVFAFLSCGDGCARPEVWRKGTWADLGPPLRVPPDATLHATWDDGGAAWVVAHRRPGTGAELDLQAFRLEGSSWAPRGAGRARAVGNPGVRPDPERTDGVVAGTLRFAAGEAPSATVSSLPRLPAGERATLLPLAGGATALLTAASRLFLSQDRGGSWQEQLWTPWPRSPRGVETDAAFWLDLPSGHDADLPLLWMDERGGSHVGAWLTAGVGNARRSFAEVQAGEPLEVALHFADGSWLLIGGCRSDERTAYLRLRAEAGPWTQVPLGAGW